MDPSRPRDRRWSPEIDRPVAGYARAADGAYIAYQMVGEGPIDLAWQPDLFSNVDALWQIPKYASWFRGLASFARLILHDRRCTGASSRSVDPPNLETRVSDCLAVLDATRTPRPRRTTGRGSGERAAGSHVAGTSPFAVLVVSGSAVFCHSGLPVGRNSRGPRPAHERADGRLGDQRGRGSG